VAGPIDVSLRPLSYPHDAFVPRLMRVGVSQASRVNQSRRQLSHACAHWAPDPASVADL